MKIQALINRQLKSGAYDDRFYLQDRVDLTYYLSIR